MAAVQHSRIPTRQIPTSDFLQDAEEFPPLGGSALTPGAGTIGRTGVNAPSSPAAFPPQDTSSNLSQSVLSSPDVACAAPQSGNAVSAAAPSGDKYGLTGLVSVIRASDQDINALALGFDLTTLGLNLNSADYLYTTFASPYSEGPTRVQPEFRIPQCYFMNPPHLRFQMFQRFHLETLFYIFYSMPCDVLQLAAAQELYNRDWRFHKEKKLWFTRAPNTEPILKTETYEKGSFLVFDPNKWLKERKDDYTLVYDQLEEKTSVQGPETASAAPATSSATPAPVVPVSAQPPPPPAAPRPR